MAKVKLLKGIPSIGQFIGDEFEMSDADAKKYENSGRVEILKAKKVEAKK